MSLLLFDIVVVSAIVGAIITFSPNKIARWGLFILWILVVLALCVFSPDIYELYEELSQIIRDALEKFDEDYSVAFIFCGVAIILGSVIGLILATESNRARYRRLRTYIKKNPAIFVLIVSWICIALAAWFFGFDIVKIYIELSKLIRAETPPTDGYYGVSVRYYGIVVAVGTVIGYIILTARNIIADNENKINSQRQISESIGQAIDQIGAFNDGKPNIEVRLGGLYSLQRIMQDSQRDMLPIARILYAYVRENVKRYKIKEDVFEEAKQEDVPLPEDLGSALNIIKQFNVEWKKQFGERPRDEQLNFSRANFSKYSFRGMDFSSFTFEYANLSHADLSYANLFDAKLTGANLKGANLSHTNLCDANLSNTNLSAAFLMHAHLDDANLSDANLSNAVLSRAGLANANLRNANLEDADLSESFLPDTDLSLVNLKGAILEQAYLFGASLKNANLERADLSDTNLSYADLTDTNLQNADLSCAELKGAKFYDTSLFDDHLSNADLSGADLSESIGLTQSKINQAKGDEETKLPEGLIAPKSWTEENE